MSLIFMAVGALIFYAAMKLKGMYRIAVSNGREVQGQVVSLVKKYERSRSLNALIKVNISGHDRYLFSPIGGQPPPYKLGENLTVLIDKREPNKAMMLMRLLPVICNVVGFFGVLFICAPIQAYFFFGLDYLDLAFGAVVVLVLLNKYRRMKKEGQGFKRKWKEFLRKASFYEEFLSEEVVEQALAGEYKDPDKLTATEAPPAPKPVVKGGSTLAGFLLISMSLVGLYFGAESAQSVYKMKQSAIRAPGKIIDREVNKGSGTTYTPVIEFSPPGEDKKYRIRGSFGSSHPSWDIGDDVTVLYFPDGPHKAIQEDGLFNYIKAIFILAISGLFGFIGLAALSSESKKNRQSHSAGSGRPREL